MITYLPPPKPVCPLTDSITKNQIPHATVLKGLMLVFFLFMVRGIWKGREFYIWIVICFTIGDRRIGETICTQPKSS